MSSHFHNDYQRYCNNEIKCILDYYDYIMIATDNILFILDRYSLWKRATPTIKEDICKKLIGQPLVKLFLP